MCREPFSAAIGLHFFEMHETHEVKGCCCITGREGARRDLKGTSGPDRIEQRGGFSLAIVGGTARKRHNGRKRRNNIRHDQQPRQRWPTRIRWP